MISRVAWLERYRIEADPVRTERRVELVVVLLALLLALQILISLVQLVFGGDPEPVAPTADTLAVVDTLQRKLTDAEGSEAIRARPLFWDGRHTLSGVGQPVDEQRDAAKSEELDQVRLLGVFGAGESAGVIALVKQKQQRILVGERVLGWELTAVAGNRAQFRQEGNSQWLQLRIRHPAAGDQQSPAPAAAKARRKRDSRKADGKGGTPEAAAAEPATVPTLSLGSRLSRPKEE